MSIYKETAAYIYIDRYVNLYISRFIYIFGSIYIYMRPFHTENGKGKQRRFSSYPFENRLNGLPHFVKQPPGLSCRLAGHSGTRLVL
jgi:hypothetical protein